MGGRQGPIEGHATSCGQALSSTSMNPHSHAWDILTFPQMGSLFF